MTVDATRNPGVSCDLTRSRWALLLWWLPIAVVVADSAIRVPGAWRIWIAAAAFAVMGTGCVLNAKRCGRTHCYATGPVALLAAVWYVLLATGVVTPHSNAVSLAIVIAVVLAFLAEFPFGRYIGKRKQIRSG